MIQIGIFNLKAKHYRRAIDKLPQYNADEMTELEIKLAVEKEAKRILDAALNKRRDSK